MTKGLCLLRIKSDFAPSSLTHDCRRPTALGGQDHDPAAPSMLLRTIAIGHHRFQAGAAGRACFNDDSPAHSPASHGHKSMRIRNAARSSDRITGKHSTARLFRGRDYFLATRPQKMALDMVTPHLQGHSSWNALTTPISGRCCHWVGFFSAHLMKIWRSMAPL
jgi:hypothetical protein